MKKIMKFVVRTKYCRIYDNSTANDLMALYAENKTFSLFKSQHVDNLFPTDLCSKLGSEHIRIRLPR